MKNLSNKEQAELVAIYRTIRASMSDADEAAAALVADMHGIRPAEVLKLAFFDGQPPRKPPTGAARAVRGLSLVLKGREAA